MASPRDTKIGREAAQWVVKFDGVDFDARTVAAFRRWLAKSPDHRAAFEAASRTWNRLDLLSKLESQPLPTDPARPLLNRRAVITAGGLGAAVLALGGSYALFGAPAAIAYETGIGEVREVALADGSTIALNASTRIEVRMAPSHRAARVLQGEALFVIAPRPASPFTIATASGTIEAGGGEVLVKVLGEGARLSLLSGSGSAWRTGASDDARVALQPLSQVALESRALTVSPIDEPLASRRLLWRQGRLAFDDTPLSEAVSDVARQTGQRFEFADPLLGRLRVGGLIEARDLDAFLVMLRDNLAVQSRRREDGVIELSSTVASAP